MGLPRKFKKEEAEGLEAVEAQIEGARRLAEEIARYRTQLAEKTGCLDEDGNFHWTEDLNAYVAWIGYSTLAYLAEHGDRESAKWVAEKGLGAPEQPFSVRIEHLSPEAAERELYALLAKQVTSGLLTQDQVYELTVQLAGGEVPALSEGETDA